MATVTGASREVPWSVHFAISEQAELVTQPSEPFCSYPLVKSTQLLWKCWPGSNQRAYRIDCSTNRAFCIYYTKRGSARYIVREVRERERDREIDRERKTEVTSPYSHWKWRWVSLPCQKFAIRTLRTETLKWSPLVMSSHFPLPKNLLSSIHPSQKPHAGCRRAQNRQLGWRQLEKYWFQTGGILKYVAWSSSCGQTGGVQSFRAPPNLLLAVLFVLVFFSLNASCERSNTIDQKGVQQAFQRYHACLGRKVSNAVGRPSKPLPRMCLDKHVGSIFGKIFFYF